MGGRTWRWRRTAVAALVLGLAGLAAPEAFAADSRIVGGKPVAEGSYSFQAALLYNGIQGGDYARQYCGGSLISPTAILTAAHCVDFYGTGPDDLDASLLRVVVGRTVLSSDAGQKRKVTKIAIHPKYDPDTMNADVAVLTLDRPVTGIKPITVVAPGGAVSSSSRRP